MFILDVSRIGANTSPPQQLQKAGGKDPEQAFGELTKSKSDAQELEDSKQSKRAVARRAGKAGNADKKGALFAITRDGKSNEEPVYYVVFDKGTQQTLYLRELCRA